MKSQRLAAVLSSLLGGSLLVSSAAAVEIYSNGPFVTHPGAHVSGADVSLAQDVTYPGYTALGFNVGPGYQLTDDFVVPPNHYWTINSAVLYAYQTGSGDADFTDARLIIWQGEPRFSNSIKRFDGSVANVLVSSTPGAYRTAQSFGTTQFSDNQRRIKSLLVAIPELTLEPGQYWMDWQLIGPDPTTPVYTPPVSILGQSFTTVGGAARLRCPPDPIDSQDSCATSGPGWFTFLNGTSPNTVDLPFKLNGTDVANVIFASGFEALPATP